jgi:hypothetical protein
MKRGLNCNQWSGHQLLGLSDCSHGGFGHLSQSGSYGERNQLAWNGLPRG